MGLLSLLFLVGLQVSYAQMHTVSGIVTDKSDGSPLPGVSVVIKGTTIGTATDLQGHYAIEASPTDMLVFSFVGMKTENYTVGDRTIINVALESDAQSLDEVVVTGYGVTRRRAFTGAATTVGAQDIVDKTDANPIKALEGTVPGLQMNVSSGQPGAPATIFIRGRNSLNSGTQPLYVIDGVPVTAGTMGMRSAENQTLSPLSTLSPADIESMTVLKDATATSIYGARAANGVIVITTKKGRSGKLQANLTVKLGMEMKPSIPKSYRPLNADRYTELQVEGLLNDYDLYGENGNAAYYNDVLFGGYFPYTPEGMKEMMYAYLETDGSTRTNWLDEVTRVGFVQEYNLDLQGGGTSETSPRFYTSFNYFNNKALVISKDLERYSGRVNFSQSPSKLVSYGFALNLSYTKTNMGAGGGYFTDPITQAYMQSPLIPVKDENGDWNFNTLNGYNPVAQRSKYGDKSEAKQYRFTVSPYVTINFREDLIFNSRVGIDYYDLKEFGFWSFLQPQGKDMRGMGEHGSTARTLLSITNTLSYVKTFNEEHNLNLMIGQEVQKTKENLTYLAASNYPLFNLNQVANAAVPSSASTSKNDYALASFFFNGQYDFRNKYYFSMSARADGSSRFGKDNKWAGFWSIGARYRLSEEDFMESTKSWLTNLTVRTSYGTSGNQDVGDTDYAHGWYASRNLFGFGYNYNGLPGSAHEQQGNPDLKWEQTNKFNVGLDVSFLDRITLEFDYYYHRTKDMVFLVPISRTTGLTTVPKNIGKLENQGIEFTINAKVLRINGFDWDLSLVGSHNKNEIIKLSTDEPIEGAITIVEKGRDIYTFKMKKYAGVDPQTGEAQWYKGTEGYELTKNYNEAGKRYVGAASPKFQGSLISRMSYKGIDFSFQLNYSFGGKIYGDNLSYDEQIGGSGFDNTTRYVYDHRWQKPGDVTDVPRFVFGDGSAANNASTRFLMNGRYLKIRTMSLGYTLPKYITDQAHLGTVRVFMTADNLYTFCAKNFRGFDPAGIGANGIQWWNYPTPRNVMFGVTVAF